MGLSIILKKGIDMSLIQGIKSIFKAKKIEKENKIREESLKEIDLDDNKHFGLKLGRFVEVKTLQTKLGSFLFEMEGESSRIEAYGSVDLGSGEVLHKYYLYNDSYIQLHEIHGVIERVQWFYFDHSDTLSDTYIKSFFENPGQDYHEKLVYREQEYSSVWAEKNEDGTVNVRPVHLQETYVKIDQPKAEIICQHYLHLYERVVEGTEFYEYLIREVEEGDDYFSEVYTLGIDVKETDIIVT